MSDEYMSKRTFLNHLRYGIPYGNFDKAAIEQLVRESPTVDVERVRHGSWKCYSPTSETRYCSLCTYETELERMSPYCPECGARMERMIEITKMNESEHNCLVCFHNYATHRVFFKGYSAGGMTVELCDKCLQELANKSESAIESDKE